ncbi:Uncharacterized protein LI90_3960 [Carbonactinospora thermoautotrophica]|uniref:DNA-binding protein n=1 Tax=Carbonactinospora thermoautotrophica TaxID=1469144 RepID=A0A132MYD5_9ACTN|nr:helicase-associated domain-containing protein [Carbonactinospora thermoautotrophica]KWX02911.1 Uncharacterized protein LI90_3960 [Carbonactinospora thermoautotrophica]
MSQDVRAEPRSLADELRARSDRELAALLAARPDLLTPVPSDVTALAARATTQASAQRALERLDTFTLQVVDVLAYLPEPASLDDVLGLIGPAEAVRAAVDRLRELALAWGTDDGLRLVRAVRDWAGPSLADTGPPAATLLGQLAADRLRELLEDLGLPPQPDRVSAVAALADRFRDRRWLAELLADAPAPAREVLDRLAQGPATGRLENAYRPVRVATVRTPVDWLLARGLLVPVDPDTVALPREVAVHLRGGRLHREVSPEPPELPTREHDPGIVDRTAAGAAFSAVRKVEDLLDLWGEDGPPVLRSGGLGVRELRRAAAALDVAEPVAALLVETAYAAGLVAESSEVDPVWLPTPAYDTWRGWPTARRWLALAEAWLDTTRLAGLVGSRQDTAGGRDKLVAALGPDLERVLAPELRRGVLEALAGLPPGVATDEAAIVAWLAWRRPLRGARLRERVTAWTLREAEALGVTGRTALASYVRPLLAGDSDAAAAALEPLLPEPLDHVLLQADLTAIAPGPLTRELARELALAADIESTGGATVYRFTESSVRRALDAGRTAADLHDLLARHSRTPVPQPLAYLVDDVARRHGRIRVGTASAYVRCDDATVLDELLADRRSAQLRLRRLAPTVLAAQAPVDVVLERLRTMGYAPAAESATGDLLVSRPQARRAPARPRPPHVVAELPRAEESLLAAAVRMIRSGDRVATAVPATDGDLGVAAEVGCEDTAALIDALAAAAEHHRPVRLSYVDYQGRSATRIVYPTGVARGYLRAYDEELGRIHSFPIHRIRGVTLLEGEPD